VGDPNYTWTPKMMLSKKGSPFPAILGFHVKLQGCPSPKLNIVPENVPSLKDS